MVEAVKAAEMLCSEGIDVTVVNARFAWPVDGLFGSLLTQGKTLITVEDHCLAGGFGSAVLEMAAGSMSDEGGENFGKISGRVITLGRGNEFVPVAKRNVQLSMMNISAEGIVAAVKKACYSNPKF